MKRCTICHASFPDDANFCPNDGGRLDIVQEAAAASAPTASSNVLGGRFAIGAGAGGHRTGQVFAARDATTNLECAVKLVAPAVVATPAAAQRVEKELKQLQKLANDQVVRVIESGKQGEQHWVAMEAVPGVSLERVVAAAPLPVERALRLALGIGEGLAEAAKQGVIHRDVAPKNVLWLEGDRVKVINFALPVPLSDRVSGVPEFMSPEQAEGKAVDQRSNIYSLGALLYYMLTGEPPFAGAPAQVMQQVIDTAPMPPTLKPAGASIPPAVEKLILRALEKSSSKRHMTLRQMLSEIETLATGAPAAVAADSAAAGKTMIGGFGTSFPPPPAAPGNGAGAATGAAELATMRGAVVAPAAAMQPPPAAPALASTMMAQAPVMPVAAAPFVPAPTPFVPAPVAPAAPMMPSAPVAPAGPVVADSGAGGKGKAPVVPPPAQQSKGKFRETMWFKKGELDEAAAQAAATAPQSPDAIPVSDKADELPIEDRYKDDGSISAKDREKFSLRTGATAMMPAIQLPEEGAPGSAGPRMNEKEIVSEMRGGRGKLIAIAVVVLLAIGGVVAFALGGSDKKPPAETTAPGAAPAPAEAPK